MYYAYLKYLGVLGWFFEDSGSQMAHQWWCVSLDLLTDFTAVLTKQQMNIQCQLFNSEAGLFTASQEGLICKSSVDLLLLFLGCVPMWAWSCWRQRGSQQSPVPASFEQLPGSLPAFLRPAGCCWQQRKLCGTRQHHWTMSVGLCKVKTTLTT